MREYIQAVEDHEFSTHVSDPKVDEHLRKAMDLPEDQKNVLGIIRNLGVGVYQSRQLVTIIHTFKDTGFETPSIRIRSIVSDGYGEYSAYDEGPGRRTSHRYVEPDPAPARKPRRTDTSMQEYEERFVQPQRGRRREPEPEEGAEEAPAPRKARPKAPKKEAPAEDVPSDLVGRRCLFHGGVAVARCGKCKAVLCRECVRSSDRCPRCNALLSGEDDAKEKPSRKAKREEPEEEERAPEEDLEQEEEEPEEPRKRPRKKSDQKGPDFNHL